MVVFVWKAVYFLFFTFYTVTGNTNTNYPRFNCNISNISVIGFGRHIFICNYGNHLPLWTWNGKVSSLQRKTEHEKSNKEI